MDQIVPTKLSELPFKVVEETDKYVVLQIGRVEFMRSDLKVSDLNWVLREHSYSAWRDPVSDSYFVRIEKPSGPDKIT